MSVLASVRRTPNASITQVVAGVLVSMFAMLTVQMSALTAYVDVFAVPDGTGRGTDALSQPITGLSQVWHQYGALLWGVYAFVLLVGVGWLWRTIFTRPPQAAWAIVPILLVGSAVFWVLNVDRFYL